MTKRVLIAVSSFLLAVVIILCLPIATSDPGFQLGGTKPTESATAATSGTTAPVGSTTVPPVTQPTEPTVIPSTNMPPATQPPVTVPPTTVPPTTVPPTTLPPTTTTEPPKPGQVRLYACDEALLEVYVELAREYYGRTGVEVILMTPAEGETCTQALSRYMQSETQPTVFCIHEEQTLQQYQQQLLDLKNTDVANALYSSDFGMYSGEKLLALPVEVDWFGYIYNTALLSGVSFSREDFFRKEMTSYSSMEYIAAYITSQKYDLGAYTFGKPNFAETALLSQQLSTVFKDPEQLRSFVDLYSGNTRTSNTALSYFKSSKIVFYPGNTDSFADVLVLGIDKLDLLPAFADGSSAMHYTCDHFWAVNSQGYEPDVAETLAFLKWMVTAQQDGTPIDSLCLLSPYKDATIVDNALEKLLRKYMATEKSQLVWNTSCVAEEDFSEFCTALAAYYSKPNDANWAEVEKWMKKKDSEPTE